MTSVAEVADQMWSVWRTIDPTVARGPNDLTSGLPQGGYAEAVATVEQGEAFKSLLERVEGSTTVIDGEDAVTILYCKWLAESWMGAEERFWFVSPVAPYSSRARFQHAFRSMQAYPFDGSDPSQYLAILRDHAGQVRQMGNTLAEQAARGIKMPAPGHASVLRHIRSMHEQALESARPSESQTRRIGRTQARKLLESVESTLSAEITPAYFELLHYLEGDYARGMPAEVGLGNYRGGEEYYRRSVYAATTLSTTVEAIHELGLEQVDMIRDQMDALRSQLNFSGSDRELHDSLGTSATRALSPDHVRTTYEGHLDRVRPLVPAYFGQLPSAECHIKRLAPTLEGGLTYGYYTPPSPTNPVGTYNFNGAALSERSLLTSASLVLHETLPGHHLQIGRQLDRQELPALRREPVSRLTGFLEGWAEYAAGVGWEMGCYDDPIDAYGRLAFERFFAQRLVIDTGMNLLGWSLEQGRDYMFANTLESETQIESELIRYTTDRPGQALSYAANSAEFRKLRRLAEQRIGQAFSLKAFHNAILDAGALPMPALQFNVERWIDGCLPASPVAF